MRDPSPWVLKQSIHLRLAYKLQELKDQLGLIRKNFRYFDRIFINLRKLITFNDQQKRL